MKPLLAAAGAEQGFVFTSHHRLATDQQLSLKWRTLSWTLLLLRRHLLRRQIVLHSSDVEGHAAPLGVFGFNEIHMSLQWHQTDIWPFKKTCMLMVCDVPLFRSGPSLVESYMKISTLTPYWLASEWLWILLNRWISLAVLPAGALHVCFPHQVWPLGVNTDGEKRGLSCTVAISPVYTST